MAKKFDTKKITLLAMFLALIISVEFLEGQFLRMPQGGSLAIAPVVFICALLIFDFSESALLFMMWRILMVLIIAPIIYSPLQFVLDYFIAYSGFLWVKLLLAKKKSLPLFITAIIIANIIRYTIHVLTGVIYFGMYAEGPVILYSLLYNLTYMAPSLIGESILGVVLHPMVIKIIKSTNSVK